MYVAEGNSGGQSRPAGWDRLEVAVRRLMEDYQLQRAQVLDAQARIAELEIALAELAGGGPDPIELRERIDQLEKENRILSERLNMARSAVEKIMSRLSFLEGQR